MKRSLYLILIVSAFLACRNESSSSHNHSHAEVLSDQLPEDFLSFYMRFHTDTIFQMEHIIFPLKVQADGSSWKKEEWIYHKPFDNIGGEYVQQFKNMSGLVLEYIQHETGQYKIEKRYIKSGDAYDLIYYHIENAYAENQEWESETD